MTGMPAPVVSRTRWVAESPAYLLGALALGLLLVSPTAAGSTGRSLVGVVATTIAGWALATALFARRRPLRLGVADRITHGRAAMTAAIAGTVVFGVVALDVGSRGSWLLVGTIVLAVVLDGVDGRVARARGEASAAGARFDMEVDAALAAVLSIAAAGLLGWWVLLIGGMRYMFVVAGWLRPALRGNLTPRESRRVIAVVQPLALATALIPGIDPMLPGLIVATALALLLYSFGRDVVALESLGRGTRGRETKRGAPGGRG